MEFAMKSSYQRRNGHERTRNAKKNSNSLATARRERALVRLEEAKVSYGAVVKHNQNEDVVADAKRQLVRIDKEIAILKTRV
jgi:hypothetical protein